MGRRKTPEGKVPQPGKPRKPRQKAAATSAPLQSIEPIEAPSVSALELAPPPAPLPEPLPAAPAPQPETPTSRHMLLVGRTALPTWWRELDWRTRLPHPAALLLGLALGWQWGGFKTILGADLDPSPATVTMLAAVVLLMAALGPRIPARFAIGLAHRIRERIWPADEHSSGKDRSFWLLRAVRERDESLLWLSLAVLSSAAGLLAIVTLAALPALERIHQYLLERFFWTYLTATSLEWVLVALVAGGMWLMNGLLAAVLAPVIGARTGSRRGQSLIAAGVLLGIGLAWCVQESMADRGISGSQCFLLGTLAMFGVSVSSAVMSHRAERRSSLQKTPPTSAPEVTGWIWLSPAAWAASSALAGSGWLTCQAVGQLASTGAGIGPGTLLIALGFSVVLAAIVDARESPSASHCGGVLWAAGACVGLAAVLAALAPGLKSFSLFQLALLAVPLGFALHRIGQAWLARAGSETLGFAQMTSAILAGAACGLILGQWWLEPALGPLGTITTGALALMAFGGLIQIHEEEGPAAARRQRLGLVFASLVAAIVLFPASAERWGRWARSIPRAGPASVAPLADIQEPHRTSPVCVIGLPPGATIPGLEGHTGQANWVLWDSAIPIGPVPADSSGHIRFLTEHTFRVAAIDRTRYGLIYQHGSAAGTSPRFSGYSVEWFCRLADRTAAGGWIVLDVPLAGQTPGSAAVIAETFEHAMRSDAKWRLAGPSDAPTLRLAGCPGSPDLFRNLLEGKWYPISVLVESDDRSMALHSLRRDQITPRLRPSAGGQPVLDWLRSRQQLPQSAP